MASKQRYRFRFGEMDDHLWVFGYGSLMWRPGFDFEERCEALMHGVHRRLCIYSHVHRGTPEKPGMVLGLDKGGQVPWHRLPGGGVQAAGDARLSA
jgi:cation transport regulator ChaC